MEDNVNLPPATPETPQVSNNEVASSPPPPVTATSPQVINTDNLFSSDQNPGGEYKKPKKLKRMIVLILILLIALGVGAYFLINTKQVTKTPVVATNKFPQLKLPNQPKQQNEQFATQYFTAGYVKYEPSKLKTISTATVKIDPVLTKSANALDREVVFMNDLSAVNTKRLVMYDVGTGVTYSINEDKAVGNYYNAKIMSNHYVVFAVLSQSDPITSTTAIKSFDLETGVTKTIAEGKSSEVPISLCCYVSKDGLRMAIPGTSTLMIYQAGEDKPTSFNVGVKVFPDTKGSSNDDYAASQRNGNYPGAIWLDDNHIMYAKSNPYSWTVDSSGSHVSANNNGLAIYDLSTGSSVDVARTGDSAVRWFTVDDKSIVYAILNKNLQGLTVMKIDDYTKPDSQPLQQVTNEDYQAKIFYDQTTKKIFIQPSGSSPGQDISTVQLLDTAAGTAARKKISGLQAPSIEGIIGPDKLIINNSIGVNNDYNLYDNKTDVLQHLFSFAQ